MVTNIGRGGGGLVGWVEQSGLDVCNHGGRHRLANIELSPVADTSCTLN